MVREGVKEGAGGSHFGVLADVTSKRGKRERRG